MYTSVRWINDYLVEPASADEQAELLTAAGFPLEDSEPVDGGDVRQDYEMTSNRGDCVCHLGLAREIAAMSGRTLKSPKPSLKPTGPAAGDIVTVENREPELCPLYTARVIRGVSVRPSPDWLADRLRARGDIPRNNIVDATNFVLFEIGQPTHVFDLAKLNGPAIIIRKAAANERFLPIGEGAKHVTLDADDLVIADAERAVALAGVKGGAETAVTNATSDILIEAATFDPVTVRNTSRRHNIASDSSYRFERGVHPAQINCAADRLTELILELAGGELCEGVVFDGAEIPEPVSVSMRLSRCRAILGVQIDDANLVDALDRLGFAPQVDGDVVRCSVPPQRLDIEREIDLIEEVSRMYGHGNIPVVETLSIRVAPPQPTEMARRDVAGLLVGAGFLESVTYSLIGEEAAMQFMPPGMGPLRLLGEGGRAERVLRPSIIPSLLQVYAHNRDHGTPDVKLFEQATTYAALTGSKKPMENRHLETVNLALLHPAVSKDSPLRLTRGVIDRLVELICGPDVEATVEPIDSVPWYAPGAVVRLRGRVLGLYGCVAQDILKDHGIDDLLCAAEIGLPAWYSDYPPQTEARALPQFPSIERDLSIVIDESVPWSDVRQCVTNLDLDMLEAVRFVTTFRGKQIGNGKKSLTLRMRFRSGERTLRHEEVDPQMQRSIEALTETFGAEIRQ